MDSLVTKATCPSASYARYSIDDTIAELHTNASSGLTFKQITERLALYGYNEFEKPEEESVLLKFWQAFATNPLILLLFASATISAIIGQFDDALSITLAIIIVVTVAFIQEQRSEKSLEALTKLVPHHCYVIREDKLRTILASELVPGDLVKFGVGDRVPADVRIIESVNLEVDESNLTGENKPCQKHTNAIKDNQHTDLHIAERANIAFMGTLIRNGHGLGIVIGTGKQTEFGEVYSMMEEVEVPKTPLQNNMDQLGKQLSLLSFVIIGVIVLIGVIQGRSWLDMFTIGVSLAVAAIPEGLPIVVTVTLALGVLRMANRKAIVKKLPSVEALGSVNVICADKTGTLTMNKMVVTKVYTFADRQITDINRNTIHLSTPLKMLLRIGNLCNNSGKNDRGEYIGQSTEIALIDLLSKVQTYDEREIFTRVSEVPFNSDQKWMGVWCNEAKEGKYFYVKGAVERVLEMCTDFYNQGGSASPLSAAEKQEIAQKASECANLGLRVVAMAYGRKADELSFVGFVTMYDPPREGIHNVVNQLLGAGVKLVMITGDSGETAQSIAHQLGIPFNPTIGCLTGPEIDSMDERQLKDVITNVTIFSRTTPKHKMAIIRAYQANGAVVAMTGDGVNDAPALRLADIGISMGESGTDVAKEAADMILVNDDLSTVLAAIEEGKSIFYNIQNFLTFQLSTSIAALTLIALSTFMGLPNPLNAMQILWINIIMDGPPAQSLGVEPVDNDVMHKPPRSKDAPILTWSLLTRVFSKAAVIVLGTLYVYIHEMHDEGVTARDTTMTFTCFVLFDMFNAMSCRSNKKSIFKVKLFSNRMFNYAVMGSLIGQLLVIYVPFFQTIFQTEALFFSDFVYLIILTSSVFWIDEMRKFWLAQQNSNLDYQMVESV
ncbi:High affinity Ca2+/Mn2+ P-type ATPase-like protein [Basidiobolus ranarum]|uniref:Calcium-transporting ATPase n=1 Tax=Basidiobolus ranarum TaxID=34480 RepID=A0ABR2X2F9_9FUNG